MRIAVTGALGQLGREICQQLGARALPLTRAELDLDAPDSIVERLVRIRPTAIINAAGYTHVDRAEQEPELAHRVNASAVGRIAEACRSLRCPLVQISTDYVFGGETARRRPYSEEEPPSPISVYGHTKLGGELAAGSWERHIIVRTCGLYGAVPRDRHFVNTMLRVGHTRSVVRVVSDQTCVPSYVPHVAGGILHLLSCNAPGTYHVVNGGAVSWYEFARELFRLARLPAQLIPITSAEYGAAARRPAFSVLADTKRAALGGSPLPHWSDALAEFMRQKPA